MANGDFSSAANEGSVGGGLIGGSGTASIGTGPWSGTYFGALSLLAPPTLTIGSGKATTSGLLGVSALGIINNGGSFNQVTATPWQANKRYTLTADVTTGGGSLDLGLLHAGNAGIALANGATRVASSATSNSMTLNLLTGSTYQLQLFYDTGSSVSGNIGINLFTEPSGLLTGSLLGSLSFDNVTLSSRMLNQVPTALAAVDATPRSGAVAATVNPPLAIRVLDAEGDPIEGVTVTFTVPASGASATVTPNPAATDANGIAQVTTTANTIAGHYTIVATVTGVATPITFDMTNQPGPASAMVGASGNAQSAVVASAFATPLAVQVTDAYGNAVPGVPVAFAAPGSGASAVLPAGPVLTGADGRAQVTPSANTVAGSYQVSATVAGVSAPTLFDLTNQAGPAAAVGAASGSGQGAVVQTPFATPLTVLVGDAYGNPVAGKAVTFVAPSSGASATVTHIVITGSDGRAATGATANGTVGAYTISAYAAGVAAPTTFTLTNLLDPAVEPGGTGEPSQNGAINSPYACALLVQVTNGTNPQPNLQVDFVAPASGPSATLSNGTTSGSAVRVTTDADGLAWVEATANAIPGDYVVAAQLLYSLAPPVEFHLRNLEANDPLFMSGFDGSCVPALGSVTVNTNESTQ